MDWTKVPYYILDLIQQVPHVDVPGLGRFEAVLHPAVIDEAAGEARPPRLEAVFHAEAHGDRDLLSAYVAFASGVTEGEAHEAILTFADEVARHTLDAATYEIIRFGKFYRNAEDKIRFTPDWEAFNLSFNGLQAVPLPEPVTAVTSEAPPPEFEPAAVPREREESVPTSPRPAGTSQPAIPVTGDEDEAPDASVRMWWGILMAAIFLIAVLCAYLAWDILSHRDALRNATFLPVPAADLAVADTVAADTPSTAEEQDTVALEVTDIPVTAPEPEQTEETEESCYVVVGAFSDTMNVRRMESRLAEMGYAAERLPGRSIIRVAIRSSCDPVALQNVLDDARARISDQAWIY